MVTIWEKGHHHVLVYRLQFLVLFERDRGCLYTRVSIWESLAIWDYGVLALVGLVEPHRD